MAVVMPLRLEEVVTLKKAHPCGSRQWRVYRLGADVGIQCLGCGRRVLMPRTQLERRVRRAGGSLASTN